MIIGTTWLFLYIGALFNKDKSRGTPRNKDKDSRDPPYFFGGAWD